MKEIKDAKFLHKSPELKVETGFSSLERFVVVNEYTDGSFSNSYNCDIMIRKGIDAVGIIPYFYEKNELYITLISNFRAPVLYREKTLLGKNIDDIDKNSIKIIEIPAGIFEDSELKAKKVHDAIKNAAARELLEETGFEVKPSEVKVLGGHYFSSPGILTEKIYIASCNITGKKAKEQKLDGTMEENIKPFSITLTEALRWCKEGIIQNAITEIAITRLYFDMLSIQEKKHTSILQKRLTTMLNEIRSLKKESEYYNKMIREFKATISHELQHPFTEVMGYLSLLKNKNISSETKYNALDIISRSIKKLYEVNTNLVKVAMKDDEKKVIQEFNVEEALNNIIEGYKVVYAKELEINIHLDEKCQKLIGYKDRFNLIMEGVVSNAFKFTPKGIITITIRLLDTIDKKELDFSPDLFNYHLMKDIIPKEVEIIVKDTGIGIKKKVLPKIYRPFYQADSRFTREFAGVGIGLSVVKDLLDTMQGSINIDSAEGAGTVVTMRIPFGVI